MKAFLWYTAAQAYGSLIRLVVIAAVGLLGLSALTQQSPNQLVGSVRDTVEVITQVDVAIKGVGGLETFLDKANTWLDQELAPAP